MLELSEGWVCVLLVVTVIALGTILGLGAQLLAMDDKHEKERALQEARAKQSEEERQRQARKDEKAREAEQERHRRELEHQHQLALAKAVQQAQEAAEGRCRNGIPDGQLEEIDSYLRDAQLRQNRQGQVLFVRAIAMPTGRMALEWSLDPTLPYVLQVVGEKNQKVVFVEHAWRGVYYDVLARGKDYVFSLHAYDGDKDLERNFKLVVKVPTEKQWERKIKQRRIEGAVEREQRIVKQIEFIEAEDALWEKARREGHKRIDESNASDPEKRKRKAALDAKLEEERQQEEERRKKKRDRQ